MTDRLKGVWVSFNQDIREDDAESTISAIKCIRGVLDVTPTLANPEDWMARRRAIHELQMKIWDVLNPDMPIDKIRLK